jgi:glyoxylase-like metal-dependent hydrolase (beta-lactamase superfamily II)
MGSQSAGRTLRREAGRRSALRAAAPAGRERCRAVQRCGWVSGASVQRLGVVLPSLGLLGPGPGPVTPAGRQGLAAGHVAGHIGQPPGRGPRRPPQPLKARIAELIPPDIAEQIPLDLLGLVTGLPAETARIPWDGPQIRIIEHQAHAPGHAALLIEERGVLVAGDMLSDVLIPLLDLNDTADPIADYLAVLRLLEGAADDVDVLVPGHGSIGGADQVHARIDQDRAYVHALRDAGVPGDPRVDPSATFGKDWLPGVHERQLQHLARRSERDGTPG